MGEEGEPHDWSESKVADQVTKTLHPALLRFMGLTAAASWSVYAEAVIVSGGSAATACFSSRPGLNFTVQRSGIRT